MQQVSVHNTTVHYTRDLTKDTIRMVATLGGQYSFDSYVDDLAEISTGGTGVKNPRGEISAIFLCVRDKVEWHPDPATGEKIYQPPLLAQRVLEFIQGKREYRPKGDCDDKACLLMAMLLNRGYVCRAIGAWQSLVPPFPGCPNPQDEQWRRINHVYIEVKNLGASHIVDGGVVQQSVGWLPLEPSSETLAAFQQSPAVKPIVRFYATVDKRVIK